MDTVSMLNKMSFYCQPILPLVYDESMSYYETLCKFVGQLNTTSDAVNKLNEGLTNEIADRQAADTALDERLTNEIADRQAADTAFDERLTDEITGRQEVDRRLDERLNSENFARREADRLLNERLNAVEEKNNKIHFLAFAGTPPHSAKPVVTMPTRSELRQWINNQDMIITLLETNNEERHIVYAMSCNYNATNWVDGPSDDFNILVPISTDYDSEGDYAVRQKIAKITIPSGLESSLDGRWGLQVIEINTPSTSADGVVNLVAAISDSDSVTCSITPSEFLGLYNMTRGGKNLCVAVNAKLEYDGLARSSSVATVDTTNRKIRIAFERDGGVYTENGVKQLNKTLDYIIGDANTNVWTHETIDSRTLDFSRYEGFQFTRGAGNVITTDDESTPNAVWAQYQSEHSGRIYQNLPVRLIDTVDNVEYWNGVFDIKSGKHMTFTFVTSNYVTASRKMLVRVIELSADANTTTWNYSEKEFELPLENATQSAAGLMSAADKTKLDGIEVGANRTVVDAELSSTSTNPVQNKVIKKYVDDHSAVDTITYVDFWPTGSEAEYLNEFNGYAIDVATDQTFDHIFDSIKAGNKTVARLYNSADKSNAPISSVDATAGGDKEIGSIRFQFVSVNTGDFVGFDFIGETITMLKSSSGTLIFVTANKNVLPTPNADGSDNGKVPTVNGKVWGLKALPNAATVDTAMSNTSINAVQNKVIKKYVDDGLSKKAPSGDYVTNNELNAKGYLTLDTLPKYGGETV